MHRKLKFKEVYVKYLHYFKIFCYKICILLECKFLKRLGEMRVMIHIRFMGIM